jgi:hypothetical protein
MQKEGIFYFSFFLNSNTSAVAHYLHVPDPLVLELCVSTGSHEWVDPMLESSPPRSS